MNSNKRLTILPLIMLALSCEKKDDEQAKTRNEQLGLSPSDCGEHEWKKTFEIDSDNTPSKVENGAWEARTIRIKTSQDSEYSSTPAAPVYSNARCAPIELALTKGETVWTSDRPLLFLNQTVASKGDSVRWDITWIFKAVDELPLSVNGFSKDELNGKERPIQKIEALATVSLANDGTSLAARTASIEGELICQKPFTEKFSWVESADASDICRVIEGTEKTECLQSTIQPTGDNCILKTPFFQLFDSDGRLVSFDFGASLSRKDRDGKILFEIDTSSVKF